MLEIDTIGKSNGQLEIPLIKITNKSKSNVDKPIVFIIGRQHPGETHSSFIIHGLINHLLTTSTQV